VLPIRGKILNVMKKKELDKAFTSNEVLNILKSMGYNFNTPNPIEKLRIGKLVLLSDADKDGLHINALLLTLLVKFMPDAFSQGLIYIAQPPAYMLKHKGKYYFGNSVEEIRGVIPKGANINNVSFLKGLGECSAEALREVVFDPETRSLLKVNPPSMSDIKEFYTLMSEDTSYRKKLLGIA
jgi:DNA gyrase subunit B